MRKTGEKIYEEAGARKSISCCLIRGASILRADIAQESDQNLIIVQKMSDGQPPNLQESNPNREDATC